MWLLIMEKSNPSKAGEGEGSCVCPRRQRGWLWRGLPSPGGEKFSFPLCSAIPAAALTPALASAGIFLLPHRLMESFRQPPPLALEGITCRVALAGPGGAGRCLRCLDFPGLGTTGKGAGAFRALLTLPPPCLALIPCLLGREKRVYPAARAIRAPAWLSPVPPDLQQQRTGAPGTPEWGPCEGVGLSWVPLVCPAVPGEMERSQGCAVLGGCIPLPIEHPREEGMG